MPLRLSELNPVLDTEDMTPGTAYLSFDCPHCHAVRIDVKIARGPDPGATRVWGWNGEVDPEKLTLTPSLNFPGHWHGFVTDGALVTVGVS